MDYKYKQFGKKLRAIRLSFGYTMDEVAEMTGITPPSQASIEKGKKSNILTNTLDRLSPIYKTDLIALLSNCGKEYDDTSICLASKTAKFQNYYDFKNFKAQIENTVMMISINQGEELPCDHPYLRFLSAYKDLTEDGVRDEERNKMELQKLLCDLQRKKGGMLEEPMLSGVEVAAGLTLALIYRRNDDFDGAIGILRKLEQYLEKNIDLSMEHHDYLGYVKISIAYVLHRLDSYQELIGLLESFVGNDRYRLKRTILVDIHSRLGIAYHLLGNSEMSKQNIGTALMYGTEKRRKAISEVLLSKYGIRHDMGLYE